MQQATAADEASLRPDIQALRGLAVALVVLHHAAPGRLAAGYLGVDLFFVISGYLITGQVLRGLAGGSFSLSTFYARRVRRLLPAAYVVLLATVAAGPWVLGQFERLDALHQHWGALALASNIVLLAQTGYFDAAAETKPLLHFWSLSLEEQYYLVLPALLMAAGAGRRGLWMLVSLTLGSLFAWWVIGRHNTDAAFYLLPARAWELGVGSVAAALQRSGWRTPAAVRWPAVAVLLVAATLSPEAWAAAAWPKLAALGVTLATAALLLVPVSGARHPALEPWVRLGDISYSLYLVHWPLIAFVNGAWVGDRDAPGLAWARAGAAALALPLAWLLWRTVEQPTRHRPPPAGWRGWGLVLLTTAAVAAVPLVFGRDATGAAAQDPRRPNHGLSPSCDHWAAWADRPECRTPGPDGGAGWAVWGDSYAMHLVPGLAVVAPGLVQMTQSSCGPLPGLGVWRPQALPGASFTREWTQQCERFNRSVLQALAGPQAPRVVLLSSLLEPYLDLPRGRLLRFDGEQAVELDPRAAEDALVHAAAGLARTLRARGQRVLWVAPPPQGGFDAGACQARRRAGLATLGAPEDCRISLTDRPALATRVTALLRRIEREADMPVLRLEPALCEALSCRTADVDGLPLYRDAGHLSIDGSRRLLPQVASAAAVDSLAR